LHRRQLLEVLAPQCALVRMCLAAWQRSACNSRIDTWSDRCSHVADIRYQALDTLATAMVGRIEAGRVAAGPMSLAWSSWRQLAADRQFRAQLATRFAERQALGRLARGALQAWAGAAREVRESRLAKEHRRANQSRVGVLTRLMARDTASRLALLAWRAWRTSAAAHGPHFLTLAEVAVAAEVVAMEIQDSPRRQSPSKPLVSRRSNINGRPPSAATASAHSASARRSSLGSTATQSRLDSPVARTQQPTLQELGPALPPAALQNQSLYNGDGATVAMRQVRSDPALCLMPPPQSPQAIAVFPTEVLPPFRSPAASAAFDGRLAAALQALSQAGPVSLSSSASTRSDSEADPPGMKGNQPSLAASLHSLARVPLGPRLPGGCSGGSSAMPSTPRESGVASDRSTCCPSTPRSSCEGPDVGLATWTNGLADVPALGPPCTPLPRRKQLNAFEYQAHSLQAPVGPQITPPRGGTSGSLVRSASSGAPRSLNASVPRRNSSPSWQAMQQTPQSASMAWCQPLSLEGRTN